MIYSFIGKGGVGKTTVSSAIALSLSRMGKTALISSDFMPSLRHIFPSDPPNLKVIELMEKEVAEKWKQRYGDEVKLVLNEFIDIDDWIVDHVASSPGVAEEFLISNIVDMEVSGEYDYIVWDTAASSSTMHLLFLEREFYEHLDRDIKIFLRIRDKFRSQKILKLLNEWKMLANQVWNEVLQSKFFIVSTMDELSLLQAEEIAIDLKSMGIKEYERIYNRCKPTLGSESNFSIPELKGTATEIVCEVEKLISEKIDRFTLRSLDKFIK